MVRWRWLVPACICQGKATQPIPTQPVAMRGQAASARCPSALAHTSWQGMSRSCRHISRGDHPCRRAQQIACGRCCGVVAQRQGCQCCRP